MVVETTVAKRKVWYRNRCYRLCYRILTEGNGGYALEVLCRCENEVEREKVLLDGTKEQALAIAKLFTRELVFPIALKETLENLL